MAGNKQRLEPRSEEKTTSKKTRREEIKACQCKHGYEFVYYQGQGRKGGDSKLHVSTLGPTCIGRVFLDWMLNEGSHGVCMLTEIPKSKEVSKQTTVEAYYGAHLMKVSSIIAL